LGKNKVKIQEKYIAMINPVKIILSLLLFLCLLNFPCTYYQFVRFVAFIGFAYLAYSANKQGNKNEVFIYIALAILFQPFVKIALGRTLWNVVDVLVGVGLLLSLFQKDTKNIPLVIWVTSETIASIYYLKTTNTTH